MSNWKLKFFKIPLKIDPKNEILMYKYNKACIGSVCQKL